MTPSTPPKPYEQEGDGSKKRNSSFSSLLFNVMSLQRSKVLFHSLALAISFRSLVSFHFSQVVIGQSLGVQLPLLRQKFSLPLFFLPLEL